MVTKFVFNKLFSKCLLRIHPMLCFSSLYGNIFQHFYCIFYLKILLNSSASSTQQIKPVSKAKNARFKIKCLLGFCEKDPKSSTLITNVPLVQNKTYLPQIEEEPIEALDRQLMSSSVLPPVSAVTALQTTGQRVSEDSAYSSDVSSQSVVDHPAKQQAYEESESFSSSSSMDGSLRSTSKQRQVSFHTKVVFEQLSNITLDLFGPQPALDVLLSLQRT